MVSKGAQQVGSNTSILCVRCLMCITCMPHIRCNGTVNFLVNTKKLTEADMDKMISFNPNLLLVIRVEPTLLGISPMY